MRGGSPCTPAGRTSTIPGVGVGGTPPPSEGKKRDAGSALEPAEHPAKKLQLDPAGGPPKDKLEEPTDLRAALHKAQCGGNLMPFTAECFHNYTCGLQYDWPTWLRPENLRDAQGKRPTDPGFNQSTLWVPNEAVMKKEGHGTPMLLQFWKLKTAHFDKIALFKVGKFYELFYYDAFVAARECNLKWMNSEKKPHVGFPEMAKHDYAKKLVDAGYKVVVVEQVERVVEQKQRTSTQTTGPTCVEREPCEVFTSGTVVDSELLSGSGSRYMLYLHFEQDDIDASTGRGVRPFAACLADCATSRLRVGRMLDAVDRNGLRTLLAQTQPSEVVFSTSNMPSEAMGIIRRLPCRPMLSAFQGDKEVVVARSRLDRYRHEHPGKFTACIETALQSEGTALAAAGTMAYLESVLLGQRILPFAMWEPLDLLGAAEAVDQQAGQRSGSAGKRMVLDATALSALEILETLEGTYKGSLLQFLDHTNTPYGFRLLKQWISAPLFDVSEIQLRHEAVEFFIERGELASQLAAGMKRISVDLERATSRVWGYALQAERRAVMYGDITAKRLSDFMSLLGAYEQAMQLLGSLPASQRMPTRLAQIAQACKDGGSFSELQKIVPRLKGSVVAVNNPKKDTVKYCPLDGADASYDAIKSKILATQNQLRGQLEALKAKYPGVQFIFMDRLPGFRYEVECDEHLLPPAITKGGADITSNRKGKIRFQTQQIKELVAQLEHLEDEQEDCIYPFLSRLFKEFYAHQAKFTAVTRLVSELDALLSLAIASKGLPGTSCRPEIVTTDANAPSTVELRACRHPVAAAKMGAAFVPNDLFLNACGVPGVLVVTGPNMGGKSTVLRQTCIALVMAQMGCRVNATACRMSPVDRIFTRIGSYDTILEGKSTLFTELEETAAVLSHGTKRSLSVLDELGRGTSTFDGAAIASAVLEELKEKVQCLVLFATHYHPVSKEAARSEKVAPFHMKAEVNPQTNEMTFLYRFLPGLCPASYGHNVARLAGLPDTVLKDAIARSAEFESGQDRCASVKKKSPQPLVTEILRLQDAGDVNGLRALFRAHQNSVVPAPCPLQPPGADI